MYVVIIGSVLYFLLRLYMFSGQRRKATALDGVIFPPVGIVAGLWKLHEGQGAIEAWWVYIAITIGLLTVTFVSFWLVDRVSATRKRRRHRHRHHR